MNPLFGAPGVPEMLLILAVVVLLFGAKKLPELARGSGRALRIFKTETKGLVDGDDDDDLKTEAQRQIEARQDFMETRTETDTERVAREQRDGV